MIDCRTKHGTWRVNGNVIKDITEHKRYKLPVCTYVSDGDFKYLEAYHDIEFFNTNGNYTGFRLKQLK